LTIQEFIADMDAVVTVVGKGLVTVEGLDPGLAVPAEIAIAILPVVEELVAAALTAWSNASGQPITVETLTLLLPNPTPLDPPTE